VIDMNSIILRWRPKYDSITQPGTLSVYASDSANNFSRNVPNSVE